MGDLILERWNKLAGLKPLNEVRKGLPASPTAQPVPGYPNYTYEVQQDGTVLAWNSKGIQVGKDKRHRGIYPTLGPGTGSLLNAIRAAKRGSAGGRGGEILLQKLQGTPYGGGQAAGTGQNIPDYVDPLLGAKWEIGIGKTKYVEMGKWKNGQWSTESDLGKQANIEKLKPLDPFDAQVSQRLWEKSGEDLLVMIVGNAANIVAITAKGKKVVLNGQNVPQAIYQAGKVAKGSNESGGRYGPDFRSIDWSNALVI